MLNVSAAWQAASIAQFRYPAYLRCNISVVPPGLEDGMSVSSTDTYSKSNVSSIVDKHPDAPVPLVTLEQNRWLLNGSFESIQDNTVTTDWWSQDSEGATLVFTFDTTYDIPGIYVVWDAVNKTYPSKITLRGYDATHTLMSTTVVEDIQSYQGFVSVPMDAVQYVELEINTWSFEGWRARVDSVLFGFSTELLSENSGRINTAETVDSSSILSSQLPKHAIKLTLRNYDLYLDPTRQTGLAKYLTERQIATFRWGFSVNKSEVEWTDSLTYLVNDINIPSESREAEISFASRLDLLTDTFIKGTYTGADRTFASLATYVLQNSTVLKASTDETPWVIPTTLSQLKTAAPIPARSVNSILQLMAAATTTMLTTQATTGYIQFKVHDTTPSNDCPLAEAQTNGDPEIQFAQPLKSISVGMYSYQPEDAPKTVGTFKAVLSGTKTLKIKYNVNFAEAVSAEVTNATLDSAEYYASYAIVTITGNGAEAVVKLTGTEVTQNVSYVTTYNDVNVSSGLNIRVDNMFITNSELMNLVSNSVRDYYKLRNKAKVNYLGYPQLEVGDCVKLSSVYEQDAAVVVEQNNITFNGGWSGVAEVV